MIDTVAKIILLLAFVLLVGVSLWCLVQEQKRLKIQFEKHQEFETMVVHYLANISEHLGMIRLIKTGEMELIRELALKVDILQNEIGAIRENMPDDE